MRSIRKSLEQFRYLNPDWSDYTCFATAITGRNFSERSIRLNFNILVNDEDYSKTEVREIYEHLYKITKKDNSEIGIDENTPRRRCVSEQKSTKNLKNKEKVKSLTEHIQSLRVENYYVPDIVLVGYGRSQTYQIKCLKCGKQFFSDDVKLDGYRNLFCDGCRDSTGLEKYLKNRNKATYPYIGNVVGWEVRSTSIDKRNHRNYNNVLKRDNYTCQYCGYSPQKHNEYRNLHIDHIKPWSMNGSNDINNMVVACEKCNLYASNKYFDTFQEKKAYILDIMKKKGQKIYV